MAATPAPDHQSPPAPRRGTVALRRLGEARSVLLGVAAIALILLFAGLITPVAVIVLLIALAMLTAWQPERGADLPPAMRGPDTAVDLQPATVRFAAALPDPCFVLDREGVVLAMNERAAAFRIGIGEVLTSRLRVPDLVAAFDRVVDGGGPERIEFVERVPNERWLVASFAPLDGRAGERPMSVLLLLDDLTERRRHEQVRVDFVANASHELRTPLASLTGFIETLRGAARDDPAARDRFLAVMHDQARRMSRLIDDLLSLSRIEMKAHLRPRDPVELGGVIRHVAEALAGQAEESGVRLELDLPDHAVTVPGDHDELVQVVANLVENACKYGGSGGRVEVTLRGPEGRRDGASVTVRDFGPGIAAEHLPRLTERFYRIDGDAGPGRGTGLGLAIVKHIANRHRARLSIESAPGRGASFIIRFPETAAPA